MSDWKPKQRAGLRWESLNLSAEEGFLLSRIDGNTSVDSLTHLTGLSAAAVTLALAKLQLGGAIEAPPARDARTPASSNPEPTGPVTAQRQRRTGPLIDATAEQPPLFSADESGDEEELSALKPGQFDDDEDAIRAALAEMSDDNLTLPALEGDDTDEGAPFADDVPCGVEPDLAAGADSPLDGAEQQEVEGKASNESADAEGAADVEEPHEDEGDVDEPDEAREARAAAADVEEGNHRKLFETTLHDLPQEEREQLGRVEGGHVLCALCFDPVPQVINAIFENPQVGFPHARLIARYHRTPQGIDVLFKRAELVRDGQVQRYLLGNPMLQDSHLKRILQSKRLAIVYKWALSRDIPEKNRNKVRQMLRSKWSTAEGDERANLVFSTEGRVLLMLAGLPFDSQTTSLLCQRTYNSMVLIQNLARFSATPPLLISHLMRQALVKRQAHLRTMLLQHANCPSDLKRKAQS